jgi:2-aminomuconate deaminase
MPDTTSTGTPLTRSLARYQHARRAGGLLFLAGQGCREPATDQCVGLTRDLSGKIVSYDISAQTSGVFANIERALASHGLDRSHLVDVTVFLTDMQDFDRMNTVWNQFFAECAPPTRTTVAVKQLPGDNFVEMKSVAAFPEE